MDPRRFQKVKKLVEQALELPVEQRAAFLDRECEGDRELRAEVERLLAEPTAGPVDDLEEQIAAALPTRRDDRGGAGKSVLRGLAGFPPQSADGS